MNQFHLPFQLLWKFNYFQIADEYIAATSYVKSFGQECVNVLIEQEKNSTGRSKSPAVDVSAIYNKICPGQCSGHGTCSNAMCICNEGIGFNTTFSSVPSIEI